jgi:hypothetical protein
MRPRNLKLTSALLLSAALTMSLSACGPEKAKSGDKAESTASATKDPGSSGKEGGGGSSGGKGKGSAGSGEEGTFDNSQPVALPLPEGAEVARAVSESNTLEMEFLTDEGAAEDAVNTYEQRLQANGYESPDGTWTRGKQTLDLAAESGAFTLTLTYPGQAPPLPEAPLQEVSSSEDDTLELTYGLPNGDDDSVSTVKSYAADLLAEGWDVPTDGATGATKGSSVIEFDSTDPEQVVVTVDVPSSTD